MKQLMTSALMISLLSATLRAQDVDGAITLSRPVAITERGKTEIATFMGIATSILPDVLRGHLRLPPGIGLKIDNVAPGSPAEKAGVKVNDILLKLDDQQIINAHQLTVLVRLKKPGEVVTLHLISQGKPVEVSVNLTQKELPVLEYPVAIIPADQEQNPLPRTGEGRASSVINHTDNEHSITINTHDDHRDIIIRDKKNNLIYSGPLNTPEDLLKVPEDLQKKVDLVQKAAGNIRIFKDAPSDPINRGDNGAM